MVSCYFYVSNKLRNPVDLYEHGVLYPMGTQKTPPLPLADVPWAATLLDPSGCSTGETHVFA